MKHYHFNDATNDTGQFSTPASFTAEPDPAGPRLACAFVNDQGDAVRQDFTHDEMARLADVLLRAMTAYRPGTHAIRPITPGVAAAVAAYQKEMERWPSLSTTPVTTTSCPAARPRARPVPARSEGDRRMTDSTIYRQIAAARQTFAQATAVAMAASDRAVRAKQAYVRLLVQKATDELAAAGTPVGSQVRLLEVPFYRNLRQQASPWLVERVVARFLGGKSEARTYVYFVRLNAKGVPSAAPADRNSCEWPHRDLRLEPVRAAPEEK